MLEQIKKSILDIKDFPKKGVVFKDIGPLLADPVLFDASIKLMSEKIQSLDFDAIAGIESRGFLFAPTLSIKHSKPLILIRKPGKLPGNTLSQSYDLEYGHSALEIQKDLISKNSKILLVDDVLATGGTASAAIELIEKCEAKVVSSLFLIELKFLKGSSKINNPCLSIISYD